jgi:hypothetical protein
MPRLLASLLVVAFLSAVACKDDNAPSVAMPPPPPTAPVPTATGTAGNSAPTAAVAPTPGPSPTPAPAAEECGGAPSQAAAPPADSPIPLAFRSFACIIDTVLQKPATDPQALAFFREAALTIPVVCTADNTQPRGAGGPACTSVGEQFAGFPSSNWRSSGGLIPVDRAIATLSRLWTETVPGATDAYGASGARMYAIGMRNSSDGPHPASVITAIIKRPPEFAGSGPLRVAMVLEWREEGGAWRLVSLTNAFVLAEEWLEPAEEVRQQMPSWQRFGP